MTLCEDYPCCGHTPSDPCDYSGPSADDMLNDPARYHVGCDHETGYCDYDPDEDEDYPDEDEDGDAFPLSLEYPDEDMDYLSDYGPEFGDYPEGPFDY